MSHPENILQVFCSAVRAKQWKKLEERGKNLIKVDRYFASSKICSVCGHKKKELALSDRMYVCECGNRMDRDVNAAVNIREEGKRIYKECA